MDFRDMIDLWPSKRILAEDLNENLATVRKWRQRNSIPPSCWHVLIESANKRQIFGVSADRLIQMVAT